MPIDLRQPQRPIGKTMPSADLAMVEDACAKMRLGEALDIRRCLPDASRLAAILDRHIASKRRRLLDLS